MDDSTETPQVCHLARLPYELRQRIFGYALQQKGTIGLQTPAWDHVSAFKQPLFAVCKSFRDEALESFYKTNTFLWHVHRPRNVDARPDSDPSKYPLGIDGSTFAITPSLPWHYPRLMKDLRRLALNIFMPSDQDPEAWKTTFPEELRSLIAALSNSNGLKMLTVTIVTGYWRNGKPLPSAELDIMSILGQLSVSGSVKVRCQPSYWECSESIYSLGLEKRIRA